MKHLLPDRATLDRLYWWDGLSQRDIAIQYGVSATSVYKAMKRYAIATRKHYRPRATCVECAQSVCKVKRWRQGGKSVYWGWSARCAIHEHLKRREYQREYSRKRRNSQHWTAGPRKNFQPANTRTIGQLFAIAREEP